MSEAGVEALIDEIYLRYSGKGHVRLSIPLPFCTKEAASRIERGLILEDGIYRARVFKGNRKLSIRFDEAVTDVKNIGLKLRRIVEGLPPEALIEPEPAPAKSSNSETPSMASIFLGQLLQKKSAITEGLLIDKETEKKATAILNEIVLFYLVRLHWEIIVNRLIKRPLHNIGPWLTLSYLLFLYVRHKKEA